ncbi:MAG: hypothetical protein P1V36_03445, partial [Planctomycetota bacterium]|nr:hypothetical protein [Planctomycetota bacterium]
NGDRRADLDASGALDIFDPPRGELLWMLRLDFDRYVRARIETREKRSLFGPTAMLPPPRQIPVPPSYRTEELLAMEVEALGLTATCHPSELWTERAKELGALATTDLPQHAGQHVKVAGWIVTDRRVRVRAPRAGQPRKRGAGRYMKFLMLEDLHGTVEVTLFPDAYARVGHRLAEAGPFLVSGTMRDDHGALTLDAHDIMALGAPA